MTIIVGAEVDRLPSARVASSLELAVFAPRAPFPRADTLRKWRKSVPSSLATMLLVPKAHLTTKDGSLRLAHMAESLKWTRAVADAIDAQAIIVQTPSDITPGQRDRERIVQYIDALKEGSTRRIVWAPLGVWEFEEAARFAKKIGVTVAFDPVEDEAPAADFVFARLRTLGVRPRLSSSLLEDVAIKLADLESAEVVVLVSSDTAVRDAKRLRGFVEGVASETGDEEDEDESDEDEDEDEDESDEDDDESDEDEDDEDEDEDESDEDDDESDEDEDDESE